MTQVTGRDLEEFRHKKRLPVKGAQVSISTQKGDGQSNTAADTQLVHQRYRSQYGGNRRFVQPGAA